MPNVFSNSLDQLGQWLSSPDGQRAFTIQPNTPLATGPDLVRPPAAQNPQGRTLFGMVARPIQYQTISSQGMPYTPGGQSGMAVSNPEPQPQASQYDLNYRMPSQRGTGAEFSPQPYSGTQQQPTEVPTMTPTGDVGGRTTLPTHVIAPYRPTMTPTGDVRGGGPTGTVQQPWGRPMGGPAPYTSPTNQAALAAQSRVGAQPVAVDHKIQNSDGSTTQIKHTTAAAKGTGASAGGQAGAIVGQGGKGGVGGQGAPSQGDMFNTVADLLTGQTGTGGQRALSGGAPSGPAPATGPPAAGQNVNLQVPAHPGLLQRIGQTIGHFFSGTLGQYQQPSGAGAPVPNQTGGSALSGISRALATGRQHVATHGGSPGVSAPAPDMSWAYNANGTPTPLGSGDIYNPVATAGLQAAGPLGDTDTYRGPNGEVYRYDVTNPRNITRIQ